MDVDEDECDNAERNDCDLNALCNNTEGSYTCRCLNGYEGDGRNCTGILFVISTANVVEYSQLKVITV